MVQDRIEGLRLDSQIKRTCNDLACHSALNELTLVALDICQPVDEISIRRCDQPNGVPVELYNSRTTNWRERR